MLNSAAAAAALKQAYTTIIKTLFDTITKSWTQPAKRGRNKMSGRLLELYLTYRTALPLAVFLLYLNTAMAVFGRLDLKSFFCGLSFLVLFQVMYSYDAHFKSKEDEINRPGGGGGARSVWHLFAAAAVPVCILLWAGFWATLLYFAVVMFLYSGPVPFSRSLKAIPGLKILLNVLNFWIVGVLAPVLLRYDASFALVFSTLRSSAAALIFIFCVTVLLDIRDIAGDREAGIRTLPLLIGVPASVGLLIILLSLTALAGITAGNVGVALFAMVMALFSLLAIRPRGRQYYEWWLAFADIFLAISFAHKLLKSVS